MFIVVGEDIVMRDSVNDKIFKLLMSDYSTDVLCTLGMTELTVVCSYIIVCAFVNTVVCSYIVVCAFVKT